MPLQYARFLQLLQPISKGLAAYSLHSLSKLFVSYWLGRTAKGHQKFKCSSLCNQVSKLCSFSHQCGGVISFETRALFVNRKFPSYTAGAIIIIVLILPFSFHLYTYFHYLSLTG